jgi:hypothetical protein
LESLDGRTLFFQRGPGGPSPLVALNLKDGSQRTVVDCVANDQPVFGVATDGLYYGDCASKPALHRLDISSGSDETLGTLEGWWGMAFTVSPDGKTVLYDRRASGGSDIMLIEDFR